MKHIFAIDDTGSPGNISESRMLKSDRKTYVSVFIHSSICEDLKSDIILLLEKYSSNRLKLKEFHFTDIINRRKEFSYLDSNGVLEIIKDFTDVLNKYYLPFFIQTITPRTLEENGLKNNHNKSLDEIALDFLFCRIKQFVLENHFENDFEVIIDEGIRKKGEKVIVENLKSVTTENYMLFDSSEDNLLIQVADFFAFTLNKNQMSMIKNKRTEFDIEVLNILNSVLNGNETSGIKPMLISEREFSKDDYDKFQIEYFKKMGVYDYWRKLNK